MITDIRRIDWLHDHAAHALSVLLSQNVGNEARR